MKKLLVLAAVAAAVGVGGFMAASGIAASSKEINISAQTSLADVLRIARESDLPVVINLVGGVQYSGRLKDESAGALVLERVPGKEFYDIYIPTAHIASVEIRVRNK